jgi:tetratricopeptide (TPR) repeat protein
MPELPDTISNEIDHFCKAGDTFADAGAFDMALEQYWAAWDQLPEPKTEWEASTWILGAVGETNFYAGDFAAGRDNLSYAMQCPNAIGNPFLHLRLGQCQFELGDIDRAYDELGRALILGGKDLFADEDPKYFAFISSKLEPPAGGW